MRKFFRELYLPGRFFILMGILVVVFAISFAVPILFIPAQLLVILVAALVIVDLILLFNRQLQLEVERITPNVMSLGDENKIKIAITNNFGMGLDLVVVDEIPDQFQVRDQEFKLFLSSGASETLEYSVRPVERGEFFFHKINLLARTTLGLVHRRWIADVDEMVPVYPSIKQMKELELKAFARISNYQGIKKIRRIGHSYEFEQIKSYVQGDDYRSINWNATSARGELMVNQYEDERAQQIYSVIDKSRVMKMPFNGLSLMDYAINASLVISNVALQKQDKAGLITFSDKIGTTMPADRRRSQLRKILTALYNEKERNLEANFELLYRAVRNIVRGRSLLFLYTNFESMYALERVLPLLRRINAQHLLVVVFFENTEIMDYSRGESQSLEEVYHRTLALDFGHKKKQVVQKLRQFGIQSILTRPEELTINTVNKYLELKARGMI